MAKMFFDFFDGRCLDQIILKINDSRFPVLCNLPTRLVVTVGVYGE